MSDDPIKNAELRGYSRGYAAGKRRKDADTRARSRRAKEDAFWQRAFLVALPFALQQEGWCRGDKPITTPKDRAKLAGEFADDALALALARFKL